MYPALQLGGLVLPTAPLTFIIGAWAALTAIEQTARKLMPEQEESIYRLTSMGLFSGLIGARVAFVLTHWSAYQDNILAIIWPINTGFNVGAGVVIGIVVAFFYGRSHQLNPPMTLDTLTPGLLISLITVSLADFLGGPGYGTLSNLPWAISLFGLRRHPVQIYEILIGLSALSLWWRNSQRRLFTGQLFLTAFALYSAGRLFVDAFRDNAPLTSGGYHVIQMVSLTILLVALFLLAHQAPLSRES